MTSFRIIPRGEWGARYAPGPYTRKVGNLEKWLHHSVTVAPDLVAPFTDDYAAVRSIEAITESRFGWGIAYSFLVTPAGLIFEGHGIDRVGAHTEGHNTAGVGICLVGNYENAKPTQAQLDAVAWLLRHGVTKGWWKTAKLNGGHRDTKATACPGRHAYSAIDDINRLANSTSVPKPSGKKTKPKSLRQLRLGSTGRDVTTWQSILKASGHDVDVDGKFGPITRGATKRWQAARGLANDGVVGPRTWARVLTSDASRSLRRGDHGAFVNVWQAIAGTTRDGVFGPKTEVATVAVQRYLGVVPDGVVASKTASALLAHWT